jgi:hypothetical protein
MHRLKTEAARAARLEAERAAQAARDYLKTPDYLWDRALNGRQFETLVMKRSK